MRKNLFRYLVVSISLLAFLGTSIFAQVDVDPSTKVRKVGKEADKIYENWLERDVDYIITKEEKRAFKQLKTNLIWAEKSKR